VQRGVDWQSVDRQSLVLLIDCYLLDHPFEIPLLSSATADQWIRSTSASPGSEWLTDCKDRKFLVKKMGIRM
jgi:hypothetical protein